MVFMRIHFKTYTIKLLYLRRVTIQFIKKYYTVILHYTIIKKKCFILYSNNVMYTYHLPNFCSIISFFIY